LLPHTFVTCCAALCVLLQWLEDDAQSPGAEQQQVVSSLRTLVNNALNE
jgi:hypothetical protein